MGQGKGGVVRWRGNARRDLSYYTVHRMNSRLVSNGQQPRFAINSRGVIYDTVTNREI